VDIENSIPSDQPMTQTMYYVIGKNNLQFGLLYSEKLCGLMNEKNDRNVGWAHEDVDYKIAPMI
jgi:hypothetical protein